MTPAQGAGEDGPERRVRRRVFDVESGEERDDGTG